MRFTPEMIAEDEKRWHARDVVTELGYCGKYMSDRKNTTNLDIRFYAYIMRKAHEMLKDNGCDEGWLCEKRTSGRQITDLLCACGNKVYFTTLLFRDGFTANELYCPNCGLSMRSPHHDKDGVWLRKHWEEVVLKAHEPRVMTLEDIRVIYHRREDHVWPFDTPPYLWVETNGRTVPYWMSWNNVIACLEGQYPKYDPDDYGKTWRLLTSRPDEKRRVETPWLK